MKKLVLGLAGVVAVAWWLFPSGAPDGAVESAEDMKPLVNRIWIDHMPTSERDKIDLFAMIDDPTMGLFSSTSQFEGDWTTFEWVLDNGLRLRMLQDNKVHKVRVVVKKGKDCEPFDYCLTMKGAPRGSKTYVSMEDWIIGSVDELSRERLVERLHLLSPPDDRDDDE